MARFTAWHANHARKLARDQAGGASVGSGNTVAWNWRYGSEGRLREVDREGKRKKDRAESEQRGEREGEGEGARERKKEVLKRD